MQVTKKLAALCLQALQQQQQQQQQQHSSAAGDLTAVALNALNVWLSKASDIMRASPQSHAAASVRQQLQDTALLQHLAPAMDAAAAQLTTAVAALEAAAADHCRRGGVSATTAVPAAAFTTVDDLIWLFPTRNADTNCAMLLSTFRQASLVLSPLLPTETYVRIQVIQPAAPAAVQLIQSVLRAQGRLSQLSQQQLLPQAVQEFCSEPGKALIMVSEVMTVLASALKGDVPRMLQSCPAADTLLLMPEFAACLTIMSLVALIALDTTTSSSSSSSSSNSSTGRGVHRSTGSRRRDPSRQQRQQASLTERGSDGGSSDLGIGVRMDCLTPLSRSLFDLLGKVLRVMGLGNA